MIYQPFFIQAFKRDVDYHEPYPVSTYLDLTNGDTIWIWKEDKDAEGISPEENIENDTRKAGEREQE